MTHHTTCADLFVPNNTARAMGYNTMLVLAGTLLLSLSARVTIPLPFSAVPVTMQTFAVLLLGALLGSKRGVLTIFVYLTEGTLGLPVFANGGAGLPYLLGPTGGYIAGFVVAAYITGYLAERGWDRRYGTTLLAMLAGNVALFVLGISWLSVLVGIEKAVLTGLVPFIGGELIKMAAAAALLPTGWKILHRIGLQ